MSDATNETVLAARAKLAAKYGQVRTGGKGSVRRKKKAVHKATSNDDKKLQTVLKRLGVNVIQSIEEVNMFREDGTVLHFSNPKVQASIASNTYAISGSSDDKRIDEIYPNGVPQPGGMSRAQMKQMQEMAKSMAAGGAGSPLPSTIEEVDEEDDDDLPDLVENFEVVSEAK